MTLKFMQTDIVLTASLCDDQSDVFRIWWTIIGPDHHKQQGKTTNVRPRLPGLMHTSLASVGQHETSIGSSASSGIDGTQRHRHRQQCLTSAVSLRNRGLQLIANTTLIRLPVFHMHEHKNSLHSDLTLSAISTPTYCAYCTMYMQQCWAILLLAKFASHLGSSMWGAEPRNPHTQEQSPTRGLWEGWSFSCIDFLTRSSSVLGSFFLTAATPAPDIWGPHPINKLTAHNGPQTTLL